jgi:hypothetical protein
MGSSSLNAEVNAFERLQTVRGPEFLVLRFEVHIMYGLGEMFWSLKSALDKRLINDDLGGDVRQFASLPGLDLLSHGLEAALHPVNANRNGVNKRERLRVFCERGREDAWNDVASI